MRFPNTVDDLLADMDRRFGEVIPKPGDDHDEIMHRSGQRSVVTHYKRLREQARNPAPAPRERGRGRDLRS